MGDRRGRLSSLAGLCALSVLVAGCAPVAGQDVPRGAEGHHWESKQPAPLVRQEFAAVAYGGRILVMGNITNNSDPGSTEMWWYDPTSDHWEQTEEAPHAFDHVALVALDDAVYSMGGFGGGISEGARDEVFAFFPEREEWRQVTGLPVPLGALSCATDDLLIYCAGGTGGDRGDRSSDRLFAYDPTTDHWSELPTALPTPQDHAGAAIVDGLLWVVGGRSAGQKGNPTRTTDGYNLITGEWVRGAQLPTSASGAGVAVMDGKLVVFGGEGPRPGVAGAAGARFMIFDEAYVYDPSTDRWAGLDRMPVGVHGQAVAVLDRSVHSIGGGMKLDVPGTDLHQVLVFDG